MCDGSHSFSDSASTTPAARHALVRAWSRVRRWISRHRRHQTVTGLNDWILRDIGMDRERESGARLEADTREAARQHWLP